MTILCRTPKLSLSKFHINLQPGQYINIGINGHLAMGDIIEQWVPSQGNNIKCDVGLVDLETRSNLTPTVFHDNRKKTRFLSLVIYGQKWQFENRTVSCRISFDCSRKQKK